MNFIPQIPTDSVYKFLAIAGIVLNVAFTIWLLTKTESLTIEVTKYSVDFAVQEIKVNDLKEDSKNGIAKAIKLKDEVDEIKKSGQKTTPEQEKKILEESNNILIQAEKIEKLAREESINITILDGKNRILNEYQKQLDYYIKLRWPVFILTIGMAIFGYIGWLKKIQYKQDQLLDLQIELLQKQVKETGK